MKICEVCGDEIGGKDGENRCQRCDDKPRKGCRANKRMVDQVMADLGLVKVKGALGGTYYE